MDLTTTKTAADKELANLKNQLAALQASSSKAIADLQAELKKVSDESASSAAAMVVLEAKGKNDDATIASLRAQGKLDSENIASLTDQLMSLASEFQAFKSDAEKAIAALQSKAKNDNTEIANLHAQNATDSETIASLTQRLIDANRREMLLAQEMQMGKESAAATIDDLKSKGKKDDDEIESLRKHLMNSSNGADQRIGVLEGRCKAYEADVNLLTKQMGDQKAASASVNDEYQSFKESSEKTVDGLVTSLEKVKIEYAQHLKECKLAAEKATKSIADLEASNKQLKEQMMALAQEYQAYKIASEKTTVGLSDSKLAAEKASRTIADLEAALRKVNDEYAVLNKERTESATSKLAAEKRISDLTAQLAALSTEYQSFNVASAQSLNQSNSSLEKVKIEYAQHLKECKLAAEKAAKSIADLEASNKQLKEQMMALAQEYQAYKVASEKTVADLEIRQKQNAKSIELLESQGKKDIVEIAALKKSLAEATNRLEDQSKTDNDLLAAVSTAEAQGRKDSAIIAELKATNAQDRTQLLALARELEAYKEKTEKMIGSLQALAKKDEESLTALKSQVLCDQEEINTIRKQLSEGKVTTLALAKEYAEYKDTTTDKLTFAQNELSAHLLICTPATDKASSTIAALDAANKKIQQEFTAYKESTAKILDEVQTDSTNSSTKLAEMTKLAKTSEDQLVLLAKEFQLYKDHAEETIQSSSGIILKDRQEISNATTRIAALETINAQQQTHLMLLAQEFAEYKDKTAQAFGTK